MSEDIHPVEEKRRIGPMGAFLMGLGIGVVGTVIVLAANEERFGLAVRRTKKKAAQVRKKIKGRIDEAVDDAKDRAAMAAESVEHGARRLSERLST